MSEGFELRLYVGSSGQRHELNVARLEGREAISSFFELWVDVVKPAGEALPEEVAAGATASLTFMRDGEEMRSIHGILDSVALRLDGDSSGRQIYRACLVPRAARSRLVKTQQIFMDVSVPDVIQKKLSLVGLKGDDVVMRLFGNYPQREFIVQYREDDSHFIFRLAEHLGVSFHFEHDSGTDAIIFSDDNTGFIQDPACEQIYMSARLDEPNRVYQIERNSRMIPRLYVVYDYNYRKPDLSLIAKTQLADGHGGGMVEYGAHIKSVEDGEALAAIRAEELRCRQLSYSGQSSIPMLAAGLVTRFEGSEHLEGNLLITAVEHLAEGAGGGALNYRNRFEALAGDRTFRPQRVTPKPSISGFVTGIVQGTDGTTDSEYAMIDEHGRYTVQFHFDSALGKLNAKASRPVRMAQPFTGASEGMHFPLKPGAEVALAFVDGDPDRPVIVGALPNHTKPSVVTSTNSTVNRISTNDGIVIQFGKPQ